MASASASSASAAKAAQHRLAARRSAYRSASALGGAALGASARQRLGISIWRSALSSAALSASASRRVIWRIWRRRRRHNQRQLGEISARGSWRHRRGAHNNGAGGISGGVGVIARNLGSAAAARHRGGNNGSSAAAWRVNGGVRRSRKCKCVVNIGAAARNRSVSAHRQRGGVNRHRLGARK